MSASAIYGVMAEFDSPSALVSAARAVCAQGYHKLDAYTPFPIEELNDVLHLHKNRLPLIVLAGGLIGGLTGFLMQYWIAAIYFPINIGGRPLNSWPSFIVIMFELTILFAAIFCFFGMLGLCGLPLPHHQMFNLQRFARASSDHFFLCIEARDPIFNAGTVTELLSEFEPLEIWKVEDD